MSDDVKVSPTATKSQESISEEKMEGDRSEVNKEYDKEKSNLDKARVENTNEDNNKNPRSNLLEEIGSPAVSTKDQKMEKAEIMNNMDKDEYEKLEKKTSINNIAVDNVVAVKKGKNKKSKSKKSKKKVFNADENIVKNDNISNKDAIEVSNILVVRANEKNRQELKQVANGNNTTVKKNKKKQSNKKKEQNCQKNVDINQKEEPKIIVEEILDINNKVVENKINEENQKVVEDEINDVSQKGDPKIIADEILDINNKVLEDEINDVNQKGDPEIIVEEILDINNKVVENKINEENQKVDPKIITDVILDINNKIVEDEINDVNPKGDPKIIVDKILDINIKVVEDEINDVNQKGDPKIIVDEILDINNKVVENKINEDNQKVDPKIIADVILDINNKIVEDEINDVNPKGDPKIIVDEILDINNKVVENKINGDNKKVDPKIIADEILDINNKIVEDKINEEINDFNQEKSDEIFAKEVKDECAKKSAVVEGKQQEENIKIEKINAESFEENKVVVESEQMKEIEIIKHLEEDTCEQKQLNKEECSTQNKKNKRKQKKNNNDDIKEEEKENAKIETFPDMKNKKKKRKENTYIVETDFLFEIKENKNKKRKQKNNGSNIGEIAVKESEIMKNGYEEEAVGIVKDAEKIKRKTLKDYLREKRAKKCTITTAIVKRLTPEEVAILTGIFPMEEPPVNEPVAAKLAVEELANNKLTAEAPDAEGPVTDEHAIGEFTDHPDLKEVTLRDHTVEGSKSNNVEGAYALDPTAPAELEPPTRKDVVLDILLEDLHEKTANLAAGEKIVLFRSVLPKTDIMCLQILKDKVSDADFLWANYYFTLKHMMGKKYSFLKSVLVHDGIPDRKYDPPAPRALTYTQKIHSFDIVMEK